ncbi:MAG: TIGR01777 family oxidoreductase [Deltaproteobacteria bacterium]|nr:MAG: TIGR01777 family oxidoreductase [Deltaproteobacteria bacterium]
MNIFITGGIGFIGTHLSNFLLARGHHVTAVGTPVEQDRIIHPNFRYISGDASQEGAWQQELENIDAVVNLAGKTIFKRWTRRYKQLLYDSRISTTRNLVAAMPENEKLVLCSASAVGYYGDRGDDILKEDDSWGDGFLAQIGRDWEKEALSATKKGIRVAIMRFGIVFGKDGGAMAKMIPAYRSFLGGPLGDGNQWFPWIHIDDLTAAVLFIIDHPELAGPFNFCAPDSVRNKELAKTMGKILKRPSSMPAPGFMIRLFLGEFGSAILGSQRAVPDKLLKNGFTFKYPHLEDAIRQIIK